MKFTDSVVSIVAISDLIEQLKETYNELSDALAKIPALLRGDAIEEIAGMALWWETEVRKRLSDDNEAGRQTVGLPSATQAILDLLTKHKDGLTAEQIQIALKGSFHTEADKPDRVIASTLSQLRANSKLLHDNGRYKLVPDAATTATNVGTTLKERVVAYFSKTGNKPATTLTLAEAVGAHTNAIRAMFSTYAPRKLFVTVDEPDAKPNTPKLWKVNEKLIELEESSTTEE